MVRVFFGLIVLVASLCAGCAGNTPPEATYICNTVGSSCTEFVSGWTAATAMSSCNTMSSTFAMGSWSSGRVAGCTTTSGGAVAVTNYYAGFGDGTVEYALMTCRAIGGDFASP